MVLQVATTSAGSTDSRFRSWQKPRPAGQAGGGRGAWVQAVRDAGQHCSAILQVRSGLAVAVRYQAADQRRKLRPPCNGVPATCSWQRRRQLCGARHCATAAAAPASVLRRYATLLCSVLSEAYTPSTSSGAPKSCSGP